MPTPLKYLDASAVLHLVFDEPGPGVALAPGDRALSSQLLEVEAARAIDRARLLGELDDATTAFRLKALADVVAMLDLVPIDAEVIARARAPFAVSVRALDAIHVATAEIVAAEARGETVEFWTHDARQGTAARSRGFTVRGSAAD